jgi:hypothetical protein
VRQNPGSSLADLEEIHAADSGSATKAAKKFIDTIAPIRRLSHRGCGKRDFLQQHAV